MEGIYRSCIRRENKMIKESKEMGITCQLELGEHLRLRTENPSEQIQLVLIQRERKIDIANQIQSMEHRSLFRMMPEVSICEVSIK